MLATDIETPYTRSVSNTEAVAFLFCRHQYHLSFDLKLAPKRTGDALTRGIVGHACLESYYKVFIGLQPGQKTAAVWDAAEAAAWATYRHYLSMDKYDDQQLILVELRPILKQYFNYARNSQLRTAKNSNQRDWIILQVEKYYELDLVDDFRYVARLDLVARIDGIVTIVDHKFVYDFWSQDDLDLNPQLPKYTGMLRNNGIRVDSTMVNQIRYRPKKREPFYTDEERFRYSWKNPTDAEVRNHLREQILISRQVIDWRAKPIEERAYNALRVLNKMICRGCPVRSLCIVGLQGDDIQNEATLRYEPNSYDYNKNIEEVHNY